MHEMVSFAPLLQRIARNFEIESYWPLRLGQRSSEALSNRGQLEIRKPILHIYNFEILSFTIAEVFEMVF